MTEREWIDAARRGDQDAFACLVRAYEKRVFALTSRMCRDPEDAAEAAQEAFLSAWQGLPSFRGESSFSTWLYRLASNACVDLLRREARHRNASSLDGETSIDLPDRSSPTPQESAERAELRRSIEAGLRALSPAHRQVLILREIHQLTYEEIGAALDLDLGTVKSRISRARRQLRQFLLSSGNFSGGPPSKGIESGTEKEGCT